jgi:hypothetical protein
VQHHQIHVADKGAKDIATRATRRLSDHEAAADTHPSQGRTSVQRSGGTCCVPGIGPSATSQIVALDWTKGPRNSYQIMLILSFLSPDVNENEATKVGGLIFSGTEKSPI